MTMIKQRRSIWPVANLDAVKSLRMARKIVKVVKPDFRRVTGHKTDYVRPLWIIKPLLVLQPVILIRYSFQENRRAIDPIRISPDHQALDARNDHPYFQNGAVAQRRRAII